MWELPLSAVPDPLVAQLSPWWVFSALAAALIAFCCWRPAIPFRALMWLFVRVFYRMRVYGAENVPPRGPALLVCNHVSYIDWLLILIAQKRVIRFVIFAAWTRMLVLRHLLRWGRAIPIDASSGPKAILKSLRTAGDALQEGDLVCIFAEGRFTRTGFLLPFHRGMEQIARRGQAPIIPVCLDELWGSIFSFYGDRTLWKWPRIIPYPVTVAFGTPLPATASATEVRQAVQKLAADCAISRTSQCRGVEREFVRTAARRPFRPCVVEADDEILNTGAPVSRLGQPPIKTFRYSTVLARAICMARVLRKKLRDEERIGIWLPLGIQNLTAHVALAFCGKTAAPLDETTTAEQFVSRLARSGINRILTCGPQLSRRPSGLANTNAVEMIDMDVIEQELPTWQLRLIWLITVILPGVIIERWLLRLHKRPLDAAALVIFAGAGDESHPVVLSRRNIAASTAAIFKTYDLTPRDRMLTMLPSADSAGIIMSLWAPLTSGMATILTKGQSPADLFRESFSTCTPSIICCRNQAIEELFAQGGAEMFRTVRLIICLGDGIPTAASAWFGQKAGIAPLGAFACDQLTSVAIANVSDKTLENFTQIGNKVGSIGQPLPGTACRIVEPGTLRELPVGEAGELLACGPTVALGYLDTNHVQPFELREGWLNTGRRASLDEDGFIRLAN